MVDEPVDESLVETGEGVIGDEGEDLDKVEDETVPGHHEESRVARCKPTPKMPTAKQVARHNLTHATYRSWCPFCVAGRKPNAPHRRVPQDRAIPLLVGDFASARSTAESEHLKMFVAKVVPQQITFAMAIDQKGATSVNVSRLARFINETGLTKFP